MAFIEKTIIAAYKALIAAIIFAWQTPALWNLFLGPAALFILADIMIGSAFSLAPTLPFLILPILAEAAPTSRLDERQHAIISLHLPPSVVLCGQLAVRAWQACPPFGYSLVLCLVSLVPSTLGLLGWAASLIVKLLWIERHQIALVRQWVRDDALRTRLEAEIARNNRRKLSLIAIFDGLNDTNDKHDERIRDIERRTPSAVRNGAPHVSRQRLLKPNLDWKFLDDCRSKVMPRYMTLWTRFWKRVDEIAAIRSAQLAMDELLFARFNEGIDALETEKAQLLKRIDECNAEEDRKEQEKIESSSLRRASLRTNGLRLRLPLLNSGRPYLGVRSSGKPYLPVVRPVVVKKDPVVVKTDPVVVKKDPVVIKTDPVVDKTERTIRAPIDQRPVVTDTTAPEVTSLAPVEVKNQGVPVAVPNTTAPAVPAPTLPMDMEVDDLEWPVAVVKTAAPEVLASIQQMEIDYPEPLTVSYDAVMPVEPAPAQPDPEIEGIIQGLQAVSLACPDSKDPSVDGFVGGFMPEEPPSAVVIYEPTQVQAAVTMYDDDMADIFSAPVQVSVAAPVPAVITAGAPPPVLPPAAAPAVSGQYSSVPIVATTAAKIPGLQTGEVVLAPAPAAAPAKAPVAPSNPVDRQSPEVGGNAVASPVPAVTSAPAPAAAPAKAPVAPSDLVDRQSPVVGGDAMASPVPVVTSAPAPAAAPANAPVAEPAGGSSATLASTTDRQPQSIPKESFSSPSTSGMVPTSKPSASLVAPALSQSKASASVLDSVPQVPLPTGGGFQPVDTQHGTMSTPSTQHSALVAPPAVAAPAAPEVAATSTSRLPARSRRSARKAQRRREANASHLVAASSSAGPTNPLSSPAGQQQVNPSVGGPSEGTVSAASLPTGPNPGAPASGASGLSYLEECEKRKDEAEIDDIEAALAEEEAAEAAACWTKVELLAMERDFRENVVPVILKAKPFYFSGPQVAAWQTKNKQVFMRNLNGRLNSGVKEPIEPAQAEEIVSNVSEFYWEVNVDPPEDFQREALKWWSPQLNKA